jgi:hypothetical protein
MTAYQPVSALFIVIGLFLLVAGIVLYFLQRSRIARSMKAQGVVTGLVRQRAEGEYRTSRTEHGIEIHRKYLYRPQVRFETQTGGKVQFIARIASRPAPYQEGDRVEVLYDPDKPQGAQINSFLYLWFYVLMLVFFGLFAMGMGALGWVMSSSG